MLTSAGGTIQDNIKKSYVESPNRGGVDTAQEVAIGNYGDTSIGNSSTAPLLTGETFTGTGEQNDLPHVAVMLKTDVTGTLFFDFSSDGVEWDSTYPVAGFEVIANVPEVHTAVKAGRYFRVRLINNGTDQTYLRLTTYYGNNFVPLVAPLTQSLTRDQDATIVRTTSYSDEVSIGRRDGVGNFNKFGYRDNLTAASGEQTIWATTTNFVPMTTASTFTIAYTNTSDGSTSNGALTLYFVYVDATGLEQIAVHTLGSTGSDVTAFTGLGINRCAVSSSGSTQTNGAAILITDTTGATTQAVLPAGSGTTQQAIFHVGSNSDGVAKYLWINLNKTSGGSAPKALIKGYVFNRQFETRYEVFRVTVDSAVEQTIYVTDPIGFALSPTDVLYFVADTDTNNTIVNIRFSIREYKRS